MASNGAKAGVASASAVSDGSLAGFANLDSMLEAYLPADKLVEARRVLYGARGPRSAARCVVRVAQR